MNVAVRFLGFQQPLPREYTPITLFEGATTADFLPVVGETWGELLKGYWDGQTGRFVGGILVASQGRMLRSEDKLTDGQELQLVSQIMGG